MEREKEKKLTEFETFVKSPPEVILVFDNYRGPNLGSVAFFTMETRAAVAALVYHSRFYSGRNFPGLTPPIVCSFAGEHEEKGEAGSQKVAEHLGKFGISYKDIVTRKNTVTTTTDLMQLHAFMTARDLKTAAIVTTDDHVLRTKIEIENHFGRGRHHGKKPNFYVLSPSSEITKELASYFGGYSSIIYSRIQDAINRGRTNALSGGFYEKLATAIALIPVRRLRVPFQRFAEQKSHPHTPVGLERIAKVAEKLSQAT